MRLTIGKKVSLGYGIVVALVIFSTLISFLFMRITKQSIEVAESTRRFVSAQNETNYRLLEAIAAIRGYHAYGNKEYSEQAINSLLQNIEQQTELLKTVNPESRTTVDRTLENTNTCLAIVSGQLNPLINEFYKAKNNNDYLKMQEIDRLINAQISVLTPLIEETKQMLSSLAAKNEAAASAQSQHAAKEAEKSALISGGIGIAAVLIGIAISLFFTRMIRKPIVQLAEITRQYAEANLQSTISAISNDEVGDLSRSVNKMREELRELIGNIASLSEQLASSAEELTASSEQSAQASSQVASTISAVAKGTETQLEAVAASATSLQQLSTAIEQVAQDSHLVADTAAKATNSAQLGGEAVNNAVTQMNKIDKTVAESAVVVAKLGERSREIGEIVGTISGIAGQTNLLALNAAIEAARAGEQGRGFAVVAEEVRKLAEQSQEAAKQISILISEIQADTENAVGSMQAGVLEVHNGISAVSKVGLTFKDIINLAEDVAVKINGISTSMREMTADMQNVAAASGAVDAASREIAGQTQMVTSVTEEQSASLAEIASSSQSLSTMAEELRSLVKKFKL